MVIAEKDCTFHPDPDAEMEEIEIGPVGDSDWICFARRCPVCGWQSVKTEQYIPVLKPCLGCGDEFLGMPDVDYDNECDACFHARLATYTKADWQSLSSEPPRTTTYE